MKKFILLLGFAIIVLGVCNYLGNQHITLVFDYLKLFDGSIPVYYNGLKVGKATEGYHSEDFKHTHLKVTLYSKKLKLPLNTKAFMKKRIIRDKEYDYLELIYPEVPSDRFISEGSFIHGKSTVDIKDYFKNQTVEDLDKIKSNLTMASENLNTSLEALSGLFILLQDMIQENRANILGMTDNLQQTTKNINNTTMKFQKSIKEEQLSNTFDNIENSTKDLNTMSNNLVQTTTQVNETIPNIDSVVENTNTLICNLNSITCGVKQTLKKNFGGFRLFFGKVIK